MLIIVSFFSVNLIKRFLKSIASLNDCTTSIVIKIVITYALTSDITSGMNLIKFSIGGLTNLTKSTEKTPQAKEDVKQI